jgi:hypothetical protein
MRKTLILTIAGVASLVAFAPAAQARDGCGYGYHRDSWGDCRLNRYERDRFYGARDPYLYGRSRVIIDPEVGVFYSGRGYWGGDRYYLHRSWDGDDWRYW